MSATLDPRPEHLARELRRLARTEPRGRRANPYVPYERVSIARAALLEIADDVESAGRALRRDIHALVRDGVDSPLLNRAVPEGELDVVLRCVRFRLACEVGAGGRRGTPLTSSSEIA